MATRVKRASTSAVTGVGQTSRVLDDILAFKSSESGLRPGLFDGES